MDPSLPALPPHPAGEQPSVEEFSATAETFAGRVHVEWDSDGLVTPLGQLPFFVEYLKQAGLFAGWVADCPLTFSSPNAPSKHDLLSANRRSAFSAKLGRAGGRATPMSDELRCWLEQIGLAQHAETFTAS